MHLFCNKGIKYNCNLYFRVVTNSRSKTSTSGEAKTSSRARFGGRGSKTVQEEVEETQQEEIQVKPKASSYRRSG